MKRFENSRSGTLWLLTAAAVIVLPAACTLEVLAASSANDVRGAVAVVPIQNEAAAKLVVDEPVPESLKQGRVVIRYRAENLRIVPVFGAPALDVSPRIGHIHVTVDDASWRWADASGEPVLLNGLPAGQHKVLIELVDANHRTLDQKTVNFVIPERITPVHHQH